MIEVLHASPQLFDVEAVRDRQLMWNLRFFHTLDTRRRWTLLKQTLELGQRRLGAGDHDLNGPIAQVSGVATQSQRCCPSPDPPPEPHSLHPTVDQEPRRSHATPFPLPLPLPLVGPAPRAGDATKRRPP